jgi:protease I
MKTVIGKAVVVAGLASSLAGTAADSAARLEAFAGETLVPRLNTTLLMNAKGADNEGFRKFLLEKAANPTELAGKRVAVLSTDGVEEIELIGVLRYLRERGAHADLVSPRRPVLPPQFGVQYPEQRNTHILTAKFMENASWSRIDKFLDEVSTADYDGVIIPGGAWNPDSLRNDPKAVKLVRDFSDAGKIVAAICHGPLVLVTAGILQGKSATAYWAVQLDLKNAGAHVEDKAVVEDGQIVTSRFPTDLPQFMNSIRAKLLRK